MKENKSGNEKFLAGLLVGAAAGAVAAIFLQSDEGKRFVNNVKDKAGDTNECLKDGLSRLQYSTNKLVDKAKDSLSKISKKGKEAIDDDTVMDGIFS